MEYGGVVLVAVVAIVAVVLLPYWIGRRQALTQSREFDRFSPRMRVLRTDDTSRGTEMAGTAVDCHPMDLRLLPGANPRPTEVSGATMTDDTEQVRRPRTRAIHSDSPARQMARLRAHRAARLAGERAAGQRRLVASAVSAAATVLVGLLALGGALTWVWLGVPAALLAASLVASRLSAIRSERVGAAEDARLRELRASREHDAESSHRGARARAGAPAREDGPAAASASGSDATSALVDGATGERGDGATGTSGADAHRAGAHPVDAHREDAHAVDTGSADTASAASASADTTSAGEEPGKAVATPTGSPARSGDQHTWTPARVPAPTYAARARVVGRTVHPDTDLRGIPRVGTAPARPVATRGMPEDSRSTEDVAAAQPIAFDLDAVLDNRRAQ